MNDTPVVADTLGMARELILRPGGLDDTRLEQVFGAVMRHRVDFADLYFQIAREESWALEDGIVKDASASIEQGAGGGRARGARDRAAGLGPGRAGVAHADRSPLVSATRSVGGTCRSGQSRM